MNFAKVKYKPDASVELVWKDAQKGDEIEHTLRSAAAPKPEFAAAFDALLPHAMKILDLPKSYSKGLAVRAVHLKRNNDDRLGVVLSLTKELEEMTPVAMSTPLLWEDAGEDSVSLPAALVPLIGELQKLAEAFLNGDRDAAPLDTRRRKRDAEHGQIDLVDEAVRAEREAARQIKRREIAAALLTIVGPAPEGAAELDDEALTLLLIDRFDAVEHTEIREDAETDRKWTGVLLHTTEAGQKVWCVALGDQAPRFWWDVADPSSFDHAASAPTLMSEALRTAVRRAWGVLPEEVPVVEPPPAVEGESTGESAEAYRARTRPSPGRDDRTGIVMQALHTALFGGSDPETTAPEMWHALHLHGASDAEIQGAAVLAFGTLRQPGWSEPVGIQSGTGEEAVQYWACEVSVDPLRLKVGKGRSRQVLDALLVPSVRSLLEIPDPAEEAPAPEAEVTCDHVNIDMDTDPPNCADCGLVLQDEPVAELVEA